MIKQISTLTKLQLKNLYGINVFRFSTDKSEKKKKLALAATYLFLILLFASYIGGMTYGYIFIGLEEMIPAYLIMLSSIIILFFSIFKAGAVIFQKNAYDILASLPVRQTAIVVSRFIRMYVENLLIALIAMLPSMVVYGIFMHPKASFYLIGILVTLFIPLIPITIATFAGALITAITSRMKHKSLVSVVLSMLLFLGIMLGISQMSAMEESFSIDMLQDLSKTALRIIQSIYPPAIWLGTAMLTGDFLLCIACISGSLLIFALVITVVSANFHWICRGLYRTGAKHNYKLKHLKKSSVLGTLYHRERKRYFSSSVYVINTMIGPIMAVLFSISVLTIGIQPIQTALGFPVDLTVVAPFLLAGIFCIMPTTCTSISMEGKEWWIVKSLPLRTKDVLDSKILLNLTIIAPFFIASELLFVCAIKPDFAELLWLIAIPVLLILFVCVFGITVNLKLPRFDWENEVTVVKQSASSFIGGFLGFVVALLCMVPCILVPAKYTTLTKLLLCFLIALITLYLYHRNNKTNLQEL
ncbi:MAG: hypothetical protein IJY09_09635 [Lachnospiraceae bacterium]|nr:hypothetical protein [Lachnospiraceae bacterium]